MDPEAGATFDIGRSKLITTRFSRLPTAIKVFLILGLTLFPLGLLATLTSVDASRDGRFERDGVAKARTTQIVGNISHIVDKHIFALRLAAISATSGDPGQPCRLLRASLRSDPSLRFQRYAFFDANGARSCSTRDFSVPARQKNIEKPSLTFDAAGRLSVRASGQDGASAYGTIDPRVLVQPDGSARIYLQEGTRVFVSNVADSARGRRVVSRARLAGSSVTIVASVETARIGTSELISILWPFAMLIAAMILGWLIVDRLLLRPIVDMQRAVLAYRPGGAAMVVPDMMTPVTEIRDLGLAFSRVTETIALHEMSLSAAVARQARLVREVHHRVKNNLQVVASLLNLHARGARSADAADAYASIQRRVDALAVVHRNHFAELEDDRGVAMRPLISELAGNLRATAPAAVAMTITLDLDQVYVNQDVAVSVAFFVTEVVEHAMMCTPDEPVGISLNRSTDTAARLNLSSGSLKADAVCTNVDSRQFERIIAGLSRQLRAVLDKNTELGFFGIEIPVLKATS